MEQQQQLEVEKNILSHTLADKTAELQLQTGKTEVRTKNILEYTRMIVCWCMFASIYLFINLPVTIHTLHSAQLYIKYHTEQYVLRVCAVLSLWSFTKLGFWSVVDLIFHLHYMLTKSVMYHYNSNLSISQ